MSLSIDTNILIWGVKRAATPNRQQMIERASRFIQRCKDEHRKIIVPSQVLAEYLVDFDADARRASMAVLHRHFFIAPLDAKAAMIAAELQQDKDAIKRAQEEYGITRQVIKADINVIATSIAAGASYLYAEDHHMIGLAKGKIIVRQLPENITQPGLFGDAPET